MSGRTDLLCGSGNVVTDQSRSQLILIDKEPAVAHHGRSPALGCIKEAGFGKDREAGVVQVHAQECAIFAETEKGTIDPDEVGMTKADRDLPPLPGNRGLIKQFVQSIKPIKKLRIYNSNIKR